jgi:hypothetical protein
VGAAHDTVCARHRARAAAASDDANWQYLATRCIADEDERDRAFLTLAERWPKNAWVLSASAYALSADMRWDDALARLQMARTLEPALRSVTAIDVARLRRLLHGPDVDLTDLTAASEGLELRVALETDTSSEHGSRGAFAALARGDLDAAWRRSAGVAAMRAHTLQLIGASDGADSAMIARALDAPLDSALQGGDLWAHIALAAREGRDAREYTDAARASYAESGDRMLRFIEVLRTTRDPVKAEAALGREPAGTRGLAYAIGTVILGPATPPVWRESAKRLLFATERPWFK